MILGSPLIKAALHTELHPTWENAFAAQNTAFQVWLQSVPQAGAQPAGASTLISVRPQIVAAAPGSQVGGTPAPLLAGVGVPLTLADLQDRKQFENKLRGVTNLSAELGANLGDVTRLLHPEWHSGLDIPVQGFAVLTSSLELWQAFHDDNKTAQVLCAAQLGANAVDVALSVVETFTSVSASAMIHGCCLIVRGATGFTKILVKMREKESRAAGGVISTPGVKLGAGKRS
jgi:hypothetical protein